MAHMTTYKRSLTTNHIRTRMCRAVHSAHIYMGSNIHAEDKQKANKLKFTLEIQNFPSKDKNKIYLKLKSSSRQRIRVMCNYHRK